MDSVVRRVGRLDRRREPQQAVMEMEITRLAIAEEFGAMPDCGLVEFAQAVRCVGRVGAYWPPARPFEAPFEWPDDPIGGARRKIVFPGVHSPAKPLADHFHVQENLRLASRNGPRSQFRLERLNR